MATRNHDKYLFAPRWSPNFRFFFFKRIWQIWSNCSVTSLTITDVELSILFLFFRLVINFVLFFLLYLLLLLFLFFRSQNSSWFSMSIEFILNSRTSRWTQMSNKTFRRKKSSSTWFSLISFFFVFSFFACYWTPDFFFNCWNFFSKFQVRNVFVNQMFLRSKVKIHCVYETL